MARGLLTVQKTANLCVSVCMQVHNVLILIYTLLCNRQNNLIRIVCSFLISTFGKRFLICDTWALRADLKSTALYNYDGEWKCCTNYRNFSKKRFGSKGALILTKS